MEAPELLGQMMVCRGEMKERQSAEMNEQKCRSARTHTHTHTECVKPHQFWMSSVSPISGRTMFDLGLDLQNGTSLYLRKPETRCIQLRFQVLKKNIAVLMLWESFN